mgnify:FL=1
MSGSDMWDKRYSAAMRNLADEAREATQDLPKPDVDQLLAGVAATDYSATSSRSRGTSVVRGRFRRNARVLLPVVAAAVPQRR